MTMTALILFSYLSADSKELVGHSTLVWYSEVSPDIKHTDEHRQDNNLVIFARETRTLQSLFQLAVGTTLTANLDLLVDLGGAEVHKENASCDRC
jgi:hypothetical protein